MNRAYQLPEPNFNSELVSLLFEIERLRASIGLVTTPREIFLDLKNLFDRLMSVVSLRIEGNHTTIFEALENDTQKPAPSKTEDLKEIKNVLDAAHYIDTVNAQLPLTHSFIRNIHSIVVGGLSITQEGDKTPGKYRNQEVAISGSDHRPPLSSTVHSEMTELLEFANAQMPLNKQMLQIALSHHRFVWIHPFNNGNGRVSRLFTYAMMRRTIFSDRGWSALNPTSVFGNDRAEYIHALSQADSLTEVGDTEWLTFFARGIKSDLDRLINLQDHTFVRANLIQPALTELRGEQIISKTTELTLLKVLELGTVKAGDLIDIFPESATVRSRAIAKLLNNGWLRTSDVGKRFYTLNLSSSAMARKLIKQLDNLGYLPKILADD